MLLNLMAVVTTALIISALVAIVLDIAHEVVVSRWSWRHKLGNSAPSPPDLP